MLAILLAGTLQTSLANEASILQQQELQHNDLMPMRNKAAASQCSMLPDSAVEVTLQHTGFHGHLIYAVNSSHISTSGNCNITILQPLPAGLYADPYELDASKSFPVNQMKCPLQVSAFKLYGSVDVEKIESACSQTLLSVSAKLEIATEMLQRQGNKADVRVSIPVHARYPAPAEKRRDGLMSSLVGFYHYHNIKPPLLYAECTQVSSLIPCFTSFAIQQHAVEQLKWKVPAGGVWHTQAVQFVTASIAILGSASLIRTICQQHQKLS